MELVEVLKLWNRGLSVFPVSNETKIPLVKWDRLQDELPSESEVRQWFSTNGRSVGIATGPVSGLFLLDLDFAKHPEALAWYEANKKNLPRTWMERTKSGGLHLYFRWTLTLNEKQVNTTGAIGQSPFPVGVDTKGYGGYSKITPSDGYEWIDPPHLAPLAFPPDWLVDLLPAKGSFENRRPLNGTIKPANWFSEALENLKDGNRNIGFTQLAGSLRARGYSADDIFKLLLPRAREVQFSDAELKVIADSVGRYSPRATVGDQRIKPISEFLKDQKKVEWICPRFFAKQAIHFVAGLNGTMKTWVLIDLAIEAAKGGGSWLGRYGLENARVMFLDQERFEGETQRRFAAMIAAKNLNGHELARLDDQLFVRSGSLTKFDEPTTLDAFRVELSEKKPDLVIIDSFATVHTKNEISRQEIQKVFEVVKQLRDQFKCTFVFIHHENNRAYNYNEGDDKRAPTTGEMAGNEAIPAAADGVLTVRRVDPDTSMVYTTKNNLAPQPGPFMVKVNDLAPDRSRIKVEAF